MYIVGSHPRFLTIIWICAYQAEKAVELSLHTNKTIAKHIAKKNQNI